jgi:hypothetical protein
MAQDRNLRHAASPPCGAVARLLRADVLVLAGHACNDELSRSELDSQIIVFDQYSSIEQLLYRLGALAATGTLTSRRLDLL